MTGYPASQNINFHHTRAGFSGVENSVSAAPKALLRLEGALALTSSGIAYWHFGFDWEFFGLLFLVPDLSMLGYLAGPKIGATSYNLAHTYALAFALGAFGLWLPQPLFTAISLIIASHIGFDRMLGYGLKYPTGFNDTHLGKTRTSLTASSSSGR